MKTELAKLNLQLTPEIARAAKRKGLLGRYVRLNLRRLIESPTSSKHKRGKLEDLTALRVLSDTDLALLFVQLCIKANKEEVIYNRYKSKFPGVNKEEVLKALREFRIETTPVIHALKTSKMVKGNAALFAALKSAQRQMKAASKKIDAYAELQWALIQQKKKLESLLNREKLSKWTMNYSHAAMELFTRTAKDIVELEMKLGWRDIVPDEVNVRVYQSVTGHIEHRVDPIGKNKMLEATRRFTQMLDSPTFDAEYEEVEEAS